MYNYNGYNGFNQGQYMPTYGTGMNQYQQQAGPELVTVQTIEQVGQIGVQPGQRKVVMVQNEPVIATRYADQMGLASTEYYRLTKFDPAMNAATGGDYVTRQEFEKVLAVLRELGAETEGK